MVLLTSWRFWVLFIGSMAFIWVSLIVLNSSELFVGGLVAAALGAILLWNKPKDRPMSGSTTPSDLATKRSPTAAGLGIVVVGVVIVTAMLWLAFMFGSKI